MSEGVYEVLEIDSKETGAADLIGKLDLIEKHLGKVVENTSKADGAHKKHEEHLKGLAGAFHHLINSGMEPFLHKAKEIAEFEFLRRFADKVIEAPAEMIEKLVELGEEMLTTAAKAERTNTSFELLFGKEPGHEVLEYIEDIAKATEFTGERMKGAAMELAKVGFQGEGLKRALAASIDIAALSPNKEEGMNAALTALERVKASGRVDARTLLRFGLGPEEFFKELSARTGEGVATLKKKVEQGKLDSGEALESLYSLIARKTGEKSLGEAGLKTGQGLEAKLTHLAELPELYFEKLADSEGVAHFKEILSSVLDELDPSGPKGQAIFKALEGAFDTVSDAIKDIDVKALSDNFIAGITAMADSIKPLMSALEGLGTLIDGLTKAADVIEKINQPWRDKKKEANKEFKDTHAVDFAVEARLKQQLAERRAAMARGEVDYGPHEDPSVRRERLYAEERGKLVGKASADGQGKGMAKGEAIVERGGERLGQSAEHGARKATETHSPSKVFEEIGQQVATGFAVGVESSTGMIDDVLAGAFAVPAPQAGRVSAMTGSPMTITIGDIIVSVPSGSNADQTGQALRAVVRDEITDILERYRAQQGG